MFRITIRPIGVVNTKPTVFMLDSLIEYFKMVRPLHKAILETYGKDVKTRSDGTDKDIIYYKDDIDLIKIEVNKVPPDEEIKGLPDAV